MNLLREFVRQTLTEAAKDPGDLPEGVFVVIEYNSEGYCVFYGSEDGYEISTPEINGSVSVNVLDKDCDGALEVYNTAAYAGWGPMLYDVAMEVATKRGGGLVSDREHVSPAAQRIWSYYLNSRPDVIATPIEQECKPETVEEDALYYRYTKEPTMIATLKAIGRLIES